MPADGPRPDARPASPFLILLLGSASCALGAEWLRFQWGAWLAVPPAAAGGVVTLAAVARAYRARRRWRRRRALADEAARAVPAAPGSDAPAGQEPRRVRAAPAQRPAPGVVFYDETRDARLRTSTADAEPASRRPLPTPGYAPAGAAPNGSGPDRERVGAARADVDVDRRGSRRD